jgi:hypothetical protein
LSIPEFSENMQRITAQARMGGQAMPDPFSRPRSGGIHRNFAEVNGVRLHYASGGSGKPIPFLHGFPEYWRAWENQLTGFGRDFLAVAPDRRGYSLSSKPAGVDEYQLKYLVEDVRGLS